MVADKDYSCVAIGTGDVVASDDIGCYAEVGEDTGAEIGASQSGGFVEEMVEIVLADESLEAVDEKTRYEAALSGKSLMYNSIEVDM